MNINHRVTHVRYNPKMSGTNFDRQQADKVLTVGEVYEVSDVVVYSWHSKVYLKNIPGSFNTVLFEDVYEEHLDLDVIAQEISLYAHNHNISYKDVLKQLQEFE